MGILHGNFENASFSCALICKAILPTEHKNHITVGISCAVSNSTEGKWRSPDSPNTVIRLYKSGKREAMMLASL